MKPLKSFLILSALCALFMAMALPAKGQIYAAQTLTSSQVVTGGATSNLNLVIDCRKQQSVGVSISFQMTGAETGNQTLTFQRSLDNSSWETLAAKKTVVTIAATGATTSVTVTNIPSAGAGYLRLASWANAGSEDVTNAVVSYGIKINAP